MTPLKELEAAARISHLCHEPDETTCVTKDGYADVAVMGTKTYEAMKPQDRVGCAVELVQEGIDAAS